MYKVDITCTPVFNSFSFKLWHVYLLDQQESIQVGCTALFSDSRWVSLWDPRKEHGTRQPDSMAITKEKVTNRYFLFEISHELMSFNPVIQYISMIIFYQQTNLRSLKEKRFAHGLNSRYMTESIIYTSVRGWNGELLIEMRTCVHTL